VDGSQASQVARWLAEVKVGSYILMCHEYKDCPFLPCQLKDSQGKYIGKFLVIGIITQVVEPSSDEERAIATSLFRFPEDYNAHTFCRVRFDKMILKKDLKPELIKYISSICQKTFTKILVEGSKLEKPGADAKTFRADLWDNATVNITPQDFEESF
jgi:hypothetical protein